MDDISGLLKFLPFLLYILYKMFGPSKEKQQRPKPASKPQRKTVPQSTPSLDDILRELTGQKSDSKASKEQTIEKPKRISLAEERAREKIEIEDHQYDFRPEYEHHADTGDSLKSIREEIEEVKGITLEEEVSNFNLRQAIIAQTILTKPDY